MRVVKYEVTLTTQDRATLEAWVRRWNIPSGLKQRAQAILWKEQGVATEEIARRQQTSSGAVRRWLRRFCHEGLAGLADRPRSGRPPVFSPRGGVARDTPRMPASR